VKRQPVPKTGQTILTLSKTEKQVTLVATNNCRNLFSPSLFPHK